MTNVRRSIHSLIAILLVIAPPVANASIPPSTVRIPETIRPGGLGGESSAADEGVSGSPGLVPHPVSDEISSELRAMLEEGELVAANGKVRKGKKKRSRSSSREAKRRKSARSRGKGAKGGANASGRGDSPLSHARELAAAGKYMEASRILFTLARNPQYRRDSAQIKYILGMMLYEMKMYQTAAFVFYDVVKQHGSQAGGQSRYLRMALEKLSLSADALDSDVLLKYAIKKIDANEFPASHRDMLYFRVGELKMQEKHYQDAARNFGRVRPESPLFSKARYSLALAYAQGGELEKAHQAFDELIMFNENAGITDNNRVSGLLGRARLLYQKQKWDAAIEAYREIPRDTEQWHEALFESTWAMLRSTRFRSALSNFHSLHSDFYEDFYQPESLLLRSIVYVFICRFDEMEKVIGLYDRIYKPVESNVKTILKSSWGPANYYKELARISANFSTLRSAPKSRSSFQIPFLVARKILKEGDVRRSLSYINHLEEEKKRIDSMSGAWGSSPIGKYARRVVSGRLSATQVYAGKLIRRHMFAIASELRDLREQNDLLRIEVIRGKKETVKKEIAGKGLVKSVIDEDTNRDYFIQNGYEYWPFTGEYWLDEIGNYHYVGVQACE